MSRHDIAIIGLAGISAADESAALRAASEALADAGYGDPARLGDLRRRTAIVSAGQAAPDLSARIAQYLNITGPAYVVDTACAPELVTLELAVNELRGGRCDMALAGAAYSGQADMLVLKRLADAERAGDRVYAVVISCVTSAAAGAATGGIGDLIQTALALNSETAPRLDGSAETPPRAGVSACGPDGIHAHVVLEAYDNQHTVQFRISGDTRVELLAEAERLRDRLAAFSSEVPLPDLAWTLNCLAVHSRLTIVAASRADLEEKLARIIERLRDERVTHIRDLEGISFCRQPESTAMLDQAVPATVERRSPAPARLPRELAWATGSDSAPVIQWHLRTMERFLEVEQQIMNSYLAERQTALPNTPVVRGPFLTEVLELVPGVRARARHRFSLERERLFADHTLGRHLSQEDPDLAGLPIVPLSIFMEILAEAGALLQPGKVLAGMRDFRAYRWITLETPDAGIELIAEQREPNAVYVAMRESRSDDTPRPLWAEGLMLYAPDYPRAAPPESFALEHERGSRWTADRLYADDMFPGPLFQVIKSMDRTGSNGAACTLEVPPRDAMIAGLPQPAFLLDPVTLDAAGQAVAFWSQEQLDPTGDIFPYALATLNCYGPPPAPGARLECRAAVTYTSDKDIRTDIDIIDAHGRLLYRIGNWENRRFLQTPEFWQLRIAPQESCLSNLWSEPVAAFRQQPLVCCRLDSFSSEFFEASHGIWLKALAYLVLSRRERQQWLSMRAVEKRKREWLLGRCAAKDAVRTLLEKHRGVQLSPADIEIVADPYGAPRAEGAWTQRLRIQPVISISHSHGTAVALAALDSGQSVGIDLECLSHRREDFETVAFSAEERKLLDAMPVDLRQEWALRMWCAKESVGKALGRGMAAGLHAFCITGVELDTGAVQLELRNGALDQFPHLRGKAMTAYTARETDFVFSTLIYQQGVVQ